MNGIIRQNLPLVLAAIVMALPVAFDRISLSTAVVVFVSIGACSWLLDRYLSSGRPTCDAPDCVDREAVSVSEDHGFCADHAAQFYEAGEEGSA